ncbi:MAG: YaiI/YqxD family protein [Thermomicrobiales bacterium]
MVRIYLDADACPVKEQVYKVAARYGLEVLVVANAPLRLPDQAGVRMVVAPGGIDAADDWIAERAGAGDLVLTADIPLAARVVEAGARALDFRGGEFTPGRVVDALASRDLNAMLRQMGVVTTGPAAFSPKDRSRFASAFDAAASRLARDGRA